MTEQLEINWEHQSSAAVEKQPPTSEGWEKSLVTTQASPGTSTKPVTLDRTAEQDSPQQRIWLLEQALEQCQLYIDELKSQLADQAFLEEQLARTEEFSHIQKQAILTLQNQLATQQELQVEIETLQQSKVELSEHLAEREASIRLKDAELANLRTQVAEEHLALDRLQDQTQRLSVQIQSSQETAVHETQQRIIAQTTAERLRTQLRDSEVTLQVLEGQLHEARVSHTHQQEIIAALQNANKSDSHKNQAIQSLSTSLLKAQNTILDLETQLSSQSIVQAQFQHSTQEFAEKEQSWQNRSEELEQQVAEMQEQILHQAQQASEYETAVQHWKDRCLTADQTVSQMKQVLEHLLSDRKEPNLPFPPKLEAAIAELSKTCLSDITDTDAIAARKNIKLDLPALLYRWRNTKP
ncbi:MAG: hypothetical protein HC790_11730 [Acaryochloridaceae cyanobacterium CSU_3_4]|nr:hypothetical protein [Acaryochloridaceae cyanobacterium CSU_3_4]